MTAGFCATDARLQAQSALKKSPIHDLRNLRVEQRNAELVISGCVGRFYHKQLAQELVLSFCNGVRVINSVLVRQAD